MNDSRYVPFDPEHFRWRGVEDRLYKYRDAAETGLGFKDVVRNTLFDSGDRQASFQWRYFEVAPGGYSSLERHDHVHAVVCLRGRGRVVAGDQVYDMRPFDFLYIPPQTPHQFVAGSDEPFGFFCVVDNERDRPRALHPDDLRRLRAGPAGDVIRV